MLCISSLHSPFIWVIQEEIEMNIAEKQSYIHTGQTQGEKEASNRRVVEQMVEGFAKQDIELIMQQFADDAVYYDMHGEGINGQPYRGKKAIRGIFERYFSDLPAHTYDDAKIVVSGDQAHANWNLVLGNQEEEGVLYRTRGSDYFELRDGKIIAKNAWIMNINKLKREVYKIRISEFLKNLMFLKGSFQ